MRKPVLLLALTVALSGPAAAQRLTGQPTIAVPDAGPERTVAAFVPQHMFLEDEFEPVVRVLGRAGFEVVICSAETTAAASTEGLFVKPTLSIRDVQPEQFGGLVLIGGIGATLYWADSALIAAVRRFDAAGRVIGAIGTMPLALANAGVLAGHRATVVRDTSAVRRIREAGARHSFNGVVADANIVTASDWRNARAFGAAVGRALENR
jgi:putative intracellular protease/amidase